MKHELNIELLKKFLIQSTTLKKTPGIESSIDGDFHLDGFGFSWYSNNEWKIYKNELIFERDNNINTVLDLIPKNIIIGHLRTMCKKSNSQISYYNSHPFIYENTIWCHDECVGDFQNNKRKLFNSIDDKYYNNILGTTYSEHLLYLYLSLYNTHNDSDILIGIQKTILDFFSFIKLLTGDISANIIYADINYIWVSRYHTNQNIEPPSLYYNINKDQVIISSEPVTQEYTIFPKNSVWIIDIKTKKISTIITLH